jgi:hypothetical protein
MEKDMKKDLSIIAKELFPNLVQDTYEELIHSYNTDGKTNINPRLSLDEAVHKYTITVSDVMENKDNWGKRLDDIFVDFHNFLTIFDEFFPIYWAREGIPYLDIGMWNKENGKKIVKILIKKIFYLSYTGMDIQDIAFTRKSPFSPEFIRIFLRLPE